jgi:hypothetical protein
MHTFPQLSVRQLNAQFELLAPGGYAAQMIVLDEIHRRALIENVVRQELPNLPEWQRDRIVFDRTFSMEFAQHCPGCAEDSFGPGHRATCPCAYSDHVVPALV